jgi:hypothetical protein
LTEKRKGKRGLGCRPSRFIQGDGRWASLTASARVMVPRPNWGKTPKEAEARRSQHMSGAAKTVYLTYDDKSDAT